MKCHPGRDKSLELFSKVFGGTNSILDQLPKWVRRQIGYRLAEGEVSFVSAVCPDYEQISGKFTYKRMGNELPYTASKHLEFMAEVMEALKRATIGLQYRMTLADTEFDLPLIVEHLARGDQDLFLAQCQDSCHVLMNDAMRLGIPLQSCERFTVVFPQWFEEYNRARDILLEAPISDHALAMDAFHRLPLYKAMAGTAVSIEYCEEMVIRQRAQYMAWGACASRIFGRRFVMINHLTPNLEFINHPLMRCEQERIPIIKLPISVMPD